MSTRPVWTMKGDLVKKTHKTKQFPLEILIFFIERSLALNMELFPIIFVFLTFGNIWSTYIFISVFYMFLYMCVVYGVGKYPMCTCGVQRMSFCNYLCSTEWSFLKVPLCSLGGSFLKVPLSHRRVLRIKLGHQACVADSFICLGILSALHFKKS